MIILTKKNQTKNPPNKTRSFIVALLRHGFSEGDSQDCSLPVSVTWCCTHVLLHQLLAKRVLIHSGTASSLLRSSLSHWKIAMTICVHISVIIPNLKSHIT